ncbi:MAG: glycosyltransferase [Clostridium sp.]|nr:glycosyltransferase [Clostridium sp.]
MSIFNLFKSRIVLIFLIIALGLIYICYEYRSKAYFALSIYIIAVALCIIIKKIISLNYKSKECDSSNYTVSVIMIVEGEDLESFINAIKNLLNQSYPLKEILIINSNSKNLNVYNMAKRIRRQVELFKDSGIKGKIDLGYIRSYPDIIIKRLAGSEGRKSAESWGITRSTGDLILACQDNISLENTKVENLIKYFEEPAVSAIIGNIKLSADKSHKLIEIFSKFNNKTSYLNIKLKSKVFNIIFGDLSLRCYRKEILLNNIKSKSEAL